jgi:hypothetical protein
MTYNEGVARHILDSFDDWTAVHPALWRANKVLFGELRSLVRAEGGEVGRKVAIDFKKVPADYYVVAKQKDAIKWKRTDKGIFAVVESEDVRGRAEDVAVKLLDFTGARVGKE